MNTIALLTAMALTAAPPAPNYERDVKPILAARCFACHGALKQEAGLRVDTAKSMLSGGDSGAIIVPGKSEESLLIRRILEPDGTLRMPPSEEGSAIAPEKVEILRNWINHGAKAPDDEQPEHDPREHWSFHSPSRPALPGVRDAEWISNPIDRFIASQREPLGLTPQPIADKRVLLRRVYLDLIGLPPSESDIAAFVADESPEAYERVVDRLLESPQHGERWGRHWMDIWRYSDWWGLGAEVRNSQKHIWHWRDWIVESLNNDVSYDEMLRQMLAADELYPDDLSKVRATGYLARQYFKFNRNVWLDETIEHTSKSFLGLTMNCIRCHDHKYDPLSQREYYHLRAFFEPYQVRTDQVVGEADYERDGIPRAFDCHLDAPTYLFTRGDEKRVEREQVFAPQFPALLRFADFKIEPVALPATAHQPGLRPWVLENQLAVAQKQIDAARAGLEKARSAVAEARKEAEKDAEQTNAEAKSENGQPPEAAGGSTGNAPLIADSFAEPRADLWEEQGGGWKFENGHLVQTMDGTTRRSLRLKTAIPRDFVAKLKYSVDGGQMWKSVGIAFDVAESQQIYGYASAYSAGSKIQLAYRQKGNDVYPPEGAIARPVPVGKVQELVIRVRNRLVNLSLDGEPVAAWRSPIKRSNGPLEIMTFDAKVTLHGFEVSALTAKDKMIEPANGSKPTSMEELLAAVVIAEQGLATAELQPDYLKARAAADRARLLEPAGNPDAITRAARSERQVNVAKGAEDVARAELELLKAPAEKKGDAEKKLASAKEQQSKAIAALDQPGESYASLIGALKTVESTTETPESRNAPFPTTSTGRRSAFARWITDAKNPLTARVAVNHLWGRHFNSPIVATVFDFGRKGRRPTHPELLDWLAVELMEHEWSMRHIHRLIVTSNTYRMSSSSINASANEKADPENRNYWRMNPSRMEAQVVRDSLLSLSQNLDMSIGGPSAHSVKEEAVKRRSLYFVHSHNDHHRFLSVFDDAGVQECYRREQSIVPQQALALTNSVQAIEAASAIANLLDQSGSTIANDEFIQRAFSLLLGSMPGEDEFAACREALNAWIASEDGDAKTNKSKEDVVRKARSNLVHVLLNHNDFVTIR